MSSDSINERMAKLEEKVDGIKGTIEDVKYTLKDFIKTADEKYAAKGDVDDLKDNQKWLVRIIIGVVVLAILGLVVVNSHQISSL